MLGLYQYPAPALEEFFAVIEDFGDRLWIPHQVGLEYQKSREGRIPEQRLVLDRLLREVDDLTTRLDSLGMPEFHPTLQLEQIEVQRTAVRSALEDLADPIRRARETTPDISPTDILTDDPLFDRITSIFEGRVGPPFSEQELAKVYEEGSRRYNAEVPPGFKDRDKDESTRYGDLVLWKQILRMARGEGGAARSVILVTNDRKDDWWRRRQSALIGPRTELVREYLETVGASFHMYTPGPFLRAAHEYLTVSVSSSTIENVQRISSSSRVTNVLRFQRMVMPEPAARILVLGQIFDAVRSGGIELADDLNALISSLGGIFASGYAAVPLFFSLINEAYGPIQVDTDPSQRLRERRATSKRVVYENHRAIL